MNRREKIRHWLANQAQALILVGPKKYAIGQLPGIVLGAVVALVASCVAS